MSSEPQAFAAAVLSAFEVAGLTTDQEVVAAKGPSTTTLTKLRKVRAGQMEMGEPRGDVLGRIDTAAEWEPGSARALWRTGATPRRASSAVDLIKRPKSPAAGLGVDRFMQELADRVTELEERLDLLEAAAPGGSVSPLGSLSERTDRTSDALAADEQGEIAGEQEAHNEP